MGNSDSVPDTIILLSDSPDGASTGIPCGEAVDVVDMCNQGYTLQDSLDEPLLWFGENGEFLRFATKDDKDNMSWYPGRETTWVPPDLRGTNPEKEE